MEMASLLESQPRNVFIKSEEGIWKIQTQNKYPITDVKVLGPPIPVSYRVLSDSMEYQADLKRPSFYNRMYFEETVNCAVEDNIPDGELRLIKKVASSPVKILPMGQDVIYSQAVQFLGENKSGGINVRGISFGYDGGGKKIIWDKSPCAPQCLLGVAFVTAELNHDEFIKIFPREEEFKAFQGGYFGTSGKKAQQIVDLWLTDEINKQSETLYGVADTLLLSHVKKLANKMISLEDADLSSPYHMCGGFGVGVSFLGSS